MMTLSFRGFALVALTMIPLTPANANLDDPRVTCKRYANKAMSQVEMSERLPNPPSGPRWVNNYAAHYGWCLNSSTKAARDSETRARSKKLQWH